MPATSSTYLLRDVPPALWERVKARAALDRLPLRSVLLLLAEAYATGHVTLSGVQQHPVDHPAEQRRFVKRAKGGAK